MENTEERLYYLARGSLKYGPFSFEELKKKKIKKDMLIWYEGLDKWVKAKKITELTGILDNSPPLVKNKPRLYSRDEMDTNVSRVFFNISLLGATVIFLYIYIIILSELSYTDLEKVSFLWFLPLVFGVSGHLLIRFNNKKPAFFASIFCCIGGIILYFFIKYL